MKIAFRVDASIEMGSGHLMRCLTLADALREKGGLCHFISREHPGHLLELIRQRGFKLTVLPTKSDTFKLNLCIDQSLPLHAPWLGCDWQADAEQTRSAIKVDKPDWLVVDHYALDMQWEQALKGCYRRLMVIDDLVDRSHDCDLLLDQTLGRTEEAYRPWVPENCVLLTGSKYALLRPEFAALREYSLKRREQAKFKHLLISMGGVDRHNATGHVLEALKGCSLPKDCRVTVIMGAQAPWLESVSQQAIVMPWLTTVRVNILDMAQLMADSDLSIGAAGSTSWERCCLGLPTMMVELAVNQRAVARALKAEQAVLLLGTAGHIKLSMASMLDQALAPGSLIRMAYAASLVTDGRGTNTVMALLL